MIKSTFKLIGILMLYFVPQIIFAQDTADVFNFATGSATAPSSFSFTPALTDNSVNYLGQIFGTVGTVLHGTSGQMLGKLFLIFNIGLLGLASVFLIYTIVMTIITAAHEGEFLGRKYNTAWIAVRTVLGLGLLVPSPTTGYSTIQVIVMWVVLQGVGFADMAWMQALGYLGTGGQVYTPPATNTKSMVDLVGTLFVSQICMYNAQYVAQNNAKLQSQISAAQQSTTGGATGTSTGASAPPGGQNVTQFRPLFTYEKSVSPAGAVSARYLLRFPGNPYPSDGMQDNACGEILIDSNGATQPNASTGVTIDQAYNTNKQNLSSNTKTQTIKAALQQIILDMDSYAQTIGGLGRTPQGYDDQVQSAVVGGAADWINITMPIRVTGNVGLGEFLMAGFGQTAAQEGWIMAGRYYYALGNIKHQLADASSIQVTVDNPAAGFSGSSLGSKGVYLSFSGDSPDVSPTRMNALLAYNDTDRGNLVNVLKYGYNQTHNASALAQSVDQSYQVNLNLGSAGILGFLLDPIGSTLLTTIAEMTTAIGDPIMSLMTIGYAFMALAATMWLGATVALFGAGAGASVLSSINSAGFALQDAVLAFIPTFTIFILGFFILGATFAYYVPLIPFIIYVFAAVGWLIGVIEAMIAAPLVALGITHPEGHDLLGKSEQALMLLLSVFLRPILMVIGLFAGMILARVILRYLNSGFFGMIFDVGGYNAISWVAPGFTLFTFMAMLTVYAMLLLSIVNQCFSLIYVIPDRVMRWLGISEQTSGVSEALQAAKGGFEQAMGGVKETGGAVTQAGGKYAKGKLRPKGKGGGEASQG